MEGKKIKAMKDNKSLGVDGIPPNLLIETVEQISIPLARVFNLSLERSKHNIIILKGFNKQVRQLQTIEFNISNL